MKWIDVNEIAEMLEDKYPNCEILSISFPQLRGMVESLEGFSDPKGNPNEKILEAIQKIWLQERED